MSTFKFNKIYVIESLLDGEKSGTDLYNDILRWKESTNLKAELITVEDKIEFYDAIFHIIKEHRDLGYYPFLHIEVHGAKNNGLKLKSAEFLSWNELYEMLVEINMNIGNNLFLTMSVCYGAYLMHEIKPNRPAPFFGFIGSFDKGFYEDSMIRYNDFYTELADSRDLYSATKRLIQSNVEDISIYAYISSEDVFKMVCENLKGFATDENIKQEINKVIEYSGPFENVEDIDIFQKLLKIKYENFEEIYKNVFFMVDKFPENKERFNL